MPWKPISAQSADLYLNRVGLKLGDWNQFATVSASAVNEHSWIHFHAPRDASKLFVFAQHVGSWLPTGDWKLFQIDNSTYLTADQAALVYGLLRVDWHRQGNDVLDPKSYLFDLKSGPNGPAEMELLLSHLIFLFLLFEAHAYLASSACRAGQYLAIQDGYVYFVAQQPGLTDAKLLLAAFEKDPLISPEWVRKILREVE